MEGHSFAAIANAVIVSLPSSLMATSDKAATLIRSRHAML
jgi:hypothetical protein